ncbi:MAG TPA: ATP-binding protein [Firmicutes bacterium]|nr:ATP-binding protein [Bacillota bacterium]
MAEITSPAKLENLEQLHNFVRDRLSETGFAKKDMNQILVAAEEAIINVLSYAYPESEGEIKVICEDTPESFTIILKDTGIPFNPLSLPEPDVKLPIQDRKIGGLGIFMIKQIMDDVKYDREADWNIFTLIKHKK